MICKWTYVIVFQTVCTRTVCKALVQPRHYWHLGLDPSSSWRTVLCTAGHLATSLVSTHNVSKSRQSKLFWTSPNVPCVWRLPWFRTTGQTQPTRSPDVVGKESTENTLWQKKPRATKNERYRGHELGTFPELKSFCTMHHPAHTACPVTFRPELWAEKCVLGLKTTEESVQCFPRSESWEWRKIPQRNLPNGDPPLYILPADVHSLFFFASLKLEKGLSPEGTKGESALGLHICKRPQIVTFNTILNWGSTLILKDTD